MIKAWAFDFSAVQGRQAPDLNDARTVQRAFDSNLRCLASLEEIGFEGVFFSEHHFLNLLCPSPNLLVAALAKMTSRLKLGVLGSVLAFHQPWRLVEELGMLDYITGGRLEIGVAPGVPPEFTFVGIPQDEIRPRYAEALDYLDQAFSQPRVSHRGKFWNFEEVPVVPRLRPETRRRKWMTVYSAGSAVVGAQRGYKICTAYQSIENVVIVYDAYREAARAAGRDCSPDDIGLRRQVLIDETDSKAEVRNKELIATAITRMAAQIAPIKDRLTRDLGEGMSEGVRQTGVMDADAPRHAGAPKKDLNPLTRTGFVSNEDEYICGSPSTVADKIIDQCRKTGTGNILAYHAVGLNEDELATHYNLWRKVIPLLSKANVKESAT
jgi:alkanesulfonate monooxygenase SsuD/methylene tetrahydromethanopterin reductase-like flavin-dependent oxidoreductase (luciferase family)